MPHHRSSRRAGAAATLLIALLAALLHPSVSRPAYADGSRHGYRSNEVVVQVDPQAGSSIDEINHDHGTSTLEEVSPDAGVYVVRTSPGEDAATETTELGYDQRVRYAEPNLIGQLPEASGSQIKGWGGFDPEPLTTQYASELIGLSQAHELSHGQATVVAVIDTGVQLDHPALAGSLTEARYDFVDQTATPDDVGNNVDDNGDGTIDEGVGHGTHVAGIIHLIAPEAKIMPLRALDSDGNGDLASLIQAINFAVNNGANVINLSLGMPQRSYLLSGAIRSATRQGVVVIAAAGNLRSNLSQYPAADSCALAVASIDSSDMLSAFSNYGSWVDFAAPGEAIYSTYPRDGYAWWSGTSMAAPFVSGQAALLHSLAPTLNARDMANLIAATARPIDGQNPAFAGMLGAGQIDLGASTAALMSGAELSAPQHIADRCVSSL